MELAGEHASATETLGRGRGGCNVVRTVAKRVLEQCQGQDPILSVYVDADRTRKSPKETLIDLKNQARAAREQSSPLGEEGWKKLEGVFDSLALRLEGFAGEGVPRGVALFASPRSGVLETVDLPSSPKPSVDLRGGPRILPLLEALCPYRDSWILVLDRQQSTFYRTHGERLTLQWEMGEELPRKVRDAGYQGGEERRLERRVDETLQRHLRSVAARLRELNDQRPAERAWVQVHRDLAEEVLRALGSIPSLPARWLQGCREGAHRGELLEEARTEALRCFFEEGEELVSRILEESSAGGTATLGLRSVLAASNQGAVHQLVLEEQEVRNGKRCPACGALGLDETECPLCGTLMEEEADLWEVLARRVLERDGEVLVLGRPSALRDHYGLGARLRFAL